MMMNMMSKMMLSCETAGLLICKRQHERLDVRERMNLFLHLLSCRLCKRFDEDIRHIQKGIDHYKECNSVNCHDHHLDKKQKNHILQELENKVNN